mmetsp:Transcript_8651/g.36063  ORF Transcript_8651/g.36063 Transcript_8651/m.36063 type:complete len:227 (-) Transcript_8651:682-1362(-)
MLPEYLAVRGSACRQHERAAQDAGDRQVGGPSEERGREDAGAGIALSRRDRPPQVAGRVRRRRPGRAPGADQQDGGGQVGRLLRARQRRRWGPPEVPPAVAERYLWRREPVPPPPVAARGHLAHGERRAGGCQALRACRARAGAALPARQRREGLGSQRRCRVPRPPHSAAAGGDGGQAPRHGAGRVCPPEVHGRHSAQVRHLGASPRSGRRCGAKDPVLLRPPQG